ncbi:MAG: hypothetical protein H8D34_05185 [Chloroflexi bacterium]|nr:hypothetical protein [Chloroflexota bacterium]
MSEKGDPKDEYLDLCETMRHFGNIRFAQMTLYLAITAGIVTTLFQSDTISHLARISLKIGGIIVTILFWLMDARAMDYWNHFRRRAIQLEKTLNFEQWSKSPADKFFSTTNILKILYILILAFWIITIVLNY